MISRLHPRPDFLLFGLWFVSFLVACAHRQPLPVTSRSEPTVEQIKHVVDRITLIEGLPPKSREPQTDKYAAAIVALGKNAAPFLVEKLTDTSPSKVVYGFQYAIGDVALVLLDDIYQPQDWPFPDGRFKIPENYGDYRDYVDFFSSPGSRRRLKESWQDFIKKH
ncbi:MAG TPA: hypothetical protein VI431_15755 [Candidatus Acidoferrum sp.]